VSYTQRQQAIAILARFAHDESLREELETVLQAADSAESDGTISGHEWSACVSTLRGLRAIDQALTALGVHPVVGPNGVVGYAHGAGPMPETRKTIGQCSKCRFFVFPHARAGRRQCDCEGAPKCGDPVPPGYGCIHWEAKP
jgi:hypothetical protein